MADLESWLTGLFLASASAGAGGIIWTRTARGGSRGSWGRLVFLAGLLASGLGSAAAAYLRADALVSLGLTAGLLTVGMVWDPGPPAATGTTPFSHLEEA